MRKNERDFLKKSLFFMRVTKESVIGVKNSYHIEYSINNGSNLLLWMKME